MEILPDVLVYRRLRQTNSSRSVAEHSDLLQFIKASLDRRRRLSNRTPVSYEFPQEQSENMGKPIQAKL